MNLDEQLKIEDIMFTGGVSRAKVALESAEDKGRGHATKYGKTIVNDFVHPLFAAITDKMTKDRAKPGRAMSYISLLDGVDLEAASYLAVRIVMNSMMQSVCRGEDQVVGPLAGAIGRSIYREHVLAQFENDHPELYQHLMRDLARRMSQDETHRFAMLRHRAASRGVSIPEWPLGGMEQVGMIMLEALISLGLLKLVSVPTIVRRGVKALVKCVEWEDDIAERINTLKSYIEVSMPMFAPCVIPPRPWTSMYDGGFYSPPMRRCSRGVLTVSMPMAVAKLYGDNVPTTFLKAVNTLQNTPWEVNNKLLSTMLSVSKVRSVGDACTDSFVGKPVLPEWVNEVPADERTEAQTKEFKQWKADTRDWHTARKIGESKVARFKRAIVMADRYKNYPAIYFVYAADTRGRLYPRTTGLNPQGTDLEKALLRFGEAHPITDKEQEKWFLIHGANKFGYDKADLEQRVNWVRSREDLIYSFAQDPDNNLGWTEAECPWQFLAWCFEFKDWVDNPDTFTTRIPISMDGSCNGLQNLSAMLRDEIGGAATNLVPSEHMHDIYQLVADAASTRLAAASYECENKRRLQQAWLAHGISRSAVKRSVMCTPYGVTRLAATDYVIHDYLEKVEVPGISKDDFKAAALVLMEHVWPAIGDVVVKGRQAMDWMKKIARKAAVANPEDVISWKTPTDFIAFQAYYEWEKSRIRTSLFGVFQLLIKHAGKFSDITKHAAGLAPNFVHSMDAAHLHLTTVACADAGIKSLAMIHDDYGTHATFAPKLAELIRESFVQMYSTRDPIQELYEKYPFFAPPSHGSLDINEVRNSQFFFS